MTSRRVRVTFTGGEPARDAKSVDVQLGQSVLEAARANGYEIESTCGGRGSCRSCRVKIVNGDVTPATVQDTVQLGAEEVRERFRLACQTKLVADCTVLIAPPHAESGHRILGAASRLAPAFTLDCGIVKHVAALAPPAGAGLSDGERLAAVLPGASPHKLPLDVLRKLPAVARNKEGRVTITTFNGNVVAIAPGDRSKQKYGMAFDVGTTSIVATLLALDSGVQLAEVASLNPQAPYGADLMSRIAFVQAGEKNLLILRVHVLNALNALINEACTRAQINPSDICKIVIVGNTCMHHILLGIDVAHIGVAPFPAVIRDSLVLPAKELPLKVDHSVPVCLLPNIGGFVGADAVASVLATRLHESDKIRLVVDIGTNTEIVLGSRAGLMACSAPAGPAFEGGQIRHGMRAAFGAIEGVEIDEDVSYRTVADAPAIGICGSGLIDAVASLVRANLVDANGALRRNDREALPAALRARLRDAEQGTAFIIVRAEQSGTGQDITITQADIRQFQLAKGAIHSAILVLERVMGVAQEQIAEIMLCGAFGNYLNIRAALSIGLLPPLPLEKISYAGNAAHRGAELALLSERLRHDAQRIGQQVTHVAIAEHPDFQDLFVSALSLRGDEVRIS